ncbi:MAG TPA: hypothetical protein VFA44_07685 [Gaiellaceae bacterium]|nr:hypothetical protein [Gaiellaceae bacterium]
MPGRDVNLPPSIDQPRPVKRLLLWAAGFAVVFALGIVIGTSLASPHSSPVVTDRAAPTGAAQAPGPPAPVSSAHTRTGAVAAAARSITAFAGDVLLEPSRLRTLVARIAASSARAQLVAAFEEASAQTRAKLGADTVPSPVILLRAVPVGYRVVRYSPNKATVAVWYVGIVGSGATVQPQQSWRTQTVELVWEHGGWKVSSYASTAGPTPALSTAEAEAPGELFAAIPRFEEFADGTR